MSFDDMPDLGPLLLPGAAEYAEDILARSKDVVASRRHLIDVPYGNDYFQKIDVFLPDDDSLAGLPVFLFLHGGAWKHGFKEWMGFMAPPIIDLPGIFISVSYRLAPMVKYPRPLEDTCDAVAWVYRNIADHGGDPERILIGGHSAGGHLAAMAALRTDYMAARGLPADVIKACFPLSAPSNLHLDEYEPDGRRAMVVRLLLEREEDDRDASPIDHVAGNETPFFVAWGSDDLVEIIDNSREFVAALRRGPGVVESHEFAGHDHMRTSAECGDADYLWVQKVRDWMIKTPALARV